MIVVLILGIVSAVAVPSINSTLNEMKLDSAAQEIVYAIHYVQSLAIKEGKVYGVRFNTWTNSFDCFTNTSFFNTVTIINPLDKKDYMLNFNAEGYLKGVDIRMTSFFGNKLTFDSLGEASASGNVFLEYAGLQKTVTVAAPIGRVTIQ